MKRLLSLAVAAALLAALTLPAAAAETKDARLAQVTQAVKDTLGLDTGGYETFRGGLSEDLVPVWDLSWQGEARSLSVSALEDGSVFASIVRGANYAVTKEHIDAAESLLREAAIVILQMEIPLETNIYAIQKAQQLGAKVVTLSGPDGYIYDPDGVSTEEKIAYLLEMRASGRNRVQDYAE